MMLFQMTEIVPSDECRYIRMTVALSYLFLSFFSFFVFFRKVVFIVKNALFSSLTLSVIHKQIPTLKLECIVHLLCQS